MEPLRLVVGDDQTLFREALSCLLESQPDLLVVAACSNYGQAAERTRALRPDIVLLEVRMSVAEGTGMAQALREAWPESKVVVLTPSEGESAVFRALRDGSAGYLVNDTRAEALFQKLREIAHRTAALPPAETVQPLPAPSPGARRDGRAARGALSERDTQVLEMLAQGKSNREIGEALGICESTVKRHVHNILRRLHVRNRTEAAAYAIRSGSGNGHQRGRSDRRPRAAESGPRDQVEASEAA